MNDNNKHQLALILENILELNVDAYGVTVEYCALEGETLLNVLQEFPHLHEALSPSLNTQKFEKLLDYFCPDDELFEIQRVATSCGWHNLADAVTKVINVTPRIQSPSNSDNELILDSSYSPSHSNWCTETISIDDVTLLAGNKSNRACDIVFIHGMKGHPFETWSFKKDENNFWPQWIARDYPNACVWSVGYPTSMTKVDTLRMGINDIAHSVLNSLFQAGTGTRPTVYVVHSMGGLVLKDMLVNAESYARGRYGEIVDNAKRIAFIATPHFGVPINSVPLIFGDLVKSDASSMMNAFEPELRKLHKGFRLLGLSNEIHGVAFYEGRTTTLDSNFGSERGRIAGAIAALKRIARHHVVPKASADPDLDFINPVLPIPSDHILCSKPTSKNQLYREVCRLINDIYS